MRATRWYGKHDIRVENVPDPTIQDSRDAIIRITTTAICGSDLHIYDGFIPTMEEGDILGHEFMGVVEEVGKANGLKKGDRVIIPFQIACGECHFCKRMETALCDRTNPEGAGKCRSCTAKPRLAFLVIHTCMEGIREGRRSTQEFHARLWRFQSTGTVN